MTGRAALVLMTSTLHHRHGSTPAAVLDRQLRLLAATGHRRVVLLGGERAGRVDALWAATGADAAHLLRDADEVTVLGHAVVATEAALARVLAADALATRSDEEGWERIDSSDGWAGVMHCPGELVRDTLAELGEWEAQGTLLRRAVQARRPRLRLPDSATAHGFDPGALAGLVAGERSGRLDVGPRMLTTIGQGCADRIARLLDGRWRRAWLIGLLAAVALALVASGAALAGLTWVAAASLPLLALAGGTAIATARLDRRAPWFGAVVALIGVALAPTLLALEPGGWTVLPVAAGAVLAGIVVSGRGAGGHRLRLDGIALATALALVSVGPLATVALATPTLLLVALTRPATRRRLRRAWRRWQN